MRRSYELFVVAMIGCGDAATPGMYRIDRAFAIHDCRSTFELTPLQPYLHVYEQGQGIEIAWCPAPMPTADCRLYDSFTDPIDDGYRATTPSARRTTDYPCLLNFTDTRATWDGAELALRTTVYGEAGSVTNCTDEEAARRGASMPCTEQMGLDATLQ